MVFGVHTNCSFPPSTGQKWKFFNFFYFLTFHNDEISYVTHVFDPLCLFFRLGLFGCLDGGKGLGARAQTACAIFHSWQLKNGNRFFLIF